MFGMGASENSQIGTVEDYYIVNNLWEAHPIHFHLINFQIMASYSLKRLPGSLLCTLYALDYLQQSGYAPFQGKSHSELCSLLE